MSTARSLSSQTKSADRRTSAETSAFPGSSGPSVVTCDPGRSMSVLDALWDDEEFARVERDVAIAELDHEAALEDEEQLVRMLVMVPHEVACELRDLDLLAVELTDDARAPMVHEEAQLLREVHLVHGPFSPRRRLIRARSPRPPAYSIRDARMPHALDSSGEGSSPDLRRRSASGPGAMPRVGGS
jgi:hypothetical protein